MTETQYQRLLDGLTQVGLRLDKIDLRLDQVDRRLDQVDLRLDQVDLRLDKTDEIIRDSHAEMRRHFDVVVEHLDHKIGLVAEGLISFEERFTAQLAQVRTDLRSEIRLAYLALDRRTSALESAAGA